MGLHGPHSRIWWIRSELSATASMRPTKIQPMVRWGMVPFGAANCTMPSAKAAIAAMAWSATGAELRAAEQGSWRAAHGTEFDRGGRAPCVTGRLNLPEHASPRRLTSAAGEVIRAAKLAAAACLWASPGRPRSGYGAPPGDAARDVRRARRLSDLDPRQAVRRGRPGRARPDVRRHHARIAEADAP